jgi:hypothetical protein
MDQLPQLLVEPIPATAEHHHRLFSQPVDVLRQAGAQLPLLAR